MHLELNPAPPGYFVENINKYSWGIVAAVGCRAWAGVGRSRVLACQQSTKEPGGESGPQETDET